MARRRRWFCVRIAVATPTWGPRINRYGPSATGRRLVGVAVFWGRHGLSVGKYI